MQKITVGSLNPVKIDAARQAFSLVWPEEEWQIEGLSIGSGVSDQPMSDAESIEGATTRAQKSMKNSDADFGVGLEGGLTLVDGRWFECGWIVVVRRDGEVGIGSTLRIIVPDKVMAFVKQGDEVGTANDKIFGRENSKQSEGHFGLMTNNIITRSQGYRDGVVAALAIFLHPDLKS